MLKDNELTLDSFTLEDASNLFLLAKEKEIGFWCGWKPHETVNESKEVINKYLKVNESYAIRVNNNLVGAIQLKFKDKSDYVVSSYEAELGFWVGKEYQNKGYCTRAILLILKHAFIDLKLSTVYCGYYEGNLASKRVQEKVGFKYYKNYKHQLVKQTNEYRDSIVSIMKKEDYLKLYGNH